GRVRIAAAARARWAKIRAGKKSATGPPILRRRKWVSDVAKSQTARRTHGTHLPGKLRSQAPLPPRRDRKTVLSSEVCHCRRGEGEEVKRIHALTHWTGRRTSSSNFTSGFRILL